MLCRTGMRNITVTTMKTYGAYPKRTFHADWALGSDLQHLLAVVIDVGIHLGHVGVT